MNLPSLKSIRVLLPFIVFLCIAPALAIVLYSGLDRLERDTEDARKDTIRVVQGFAAEHDRAVTGTRQFLLTLSLLPELQRMDLAAVDRLNRDLLRQTPLYGNIFVVDGDGTLVGSVLPFSRQSVKHRKYFQDILKKKDFAVGEYVLSITLRKPALHFAYPVQDGSGHFKGVIAAALDIEQYGDIFSAVKLPEGSALTLIDNKGTILYRHPGNEQYMGKPDFPSHWKNMTEGPPEGTFISIGGESLKRLYAYKRFTLKNGDRPYLYIRVGIPEETALRHARESLGFNMGLLGIALVAALIASWFLGRVLVLRRLDRTVRAADELSQGDLKARTGMAHSPDELGILAKSFDDMAEKLQQKNMNQKATEEALRRSEEKYRSIFENAIEGIFQRSPAGHYITANPAAARILGYASPAEMIACVKDIVTQHYVNAADGKRFSDLLEKQGYVPKFEAQLYRRDGSIIWLNINAWVVRDPQGRLLYYEGTYEDITDKKTAEEARRQSEERLRLITDGVQDLIFTTDLNFNITYINAYADYTLGHAAADCLGQPLSILVVPESLQAFKTSLNLALEEERRGTADPYRTWFSEFRLLDRSGTPHVFENKASLLRNDAGRVVGILCFAWDVTQRRQAEEALRESEGKYRDLANNIPDVVCSFDKNGRITVANNSILDHYGYEQHEVLGRYFLDFVHPDDRERITQVFAEAHRAKHTNIKGLEYRVISKDGSAHWIELHGRSQYGPGNHFLRMEAVLRDIDDRVQAKQERERLEGQLLQAQKLEAVGTLAGGIAHDFNNLLMGIQGYTSLMLHDLPSNSPYYPKLKNIEAQVKSGSELTRQLLGVARGGKYEVKPLCLNDIVAKTAKLFGRAKKEIVIHQHLPTDIWTVEADASQIEQILMNLYVNAWQAMPAGGELYLQSENVYLNEDYVLPHNVAPGNYVKLSITDTGVGMDRKVLDRIFDPFFTTKGMGRGTGLGLATVYGIIKNHNGIITVYSEPGDGSTFNIYLPASAKASIPRSEFPEDIVPGSGTILVVDDESTIVDVTSRLLETLGYTVLTAGSGADALTVFAQNGDQISLVILDMIMPGMSGGETFDALRRLDPNVRVILASGYSINGQAASILDRGCRSFLQKPFRLEILSQRIREALEDPAP